MRSRPNSPYPGVIPDESREDVIATLYTITNVDQQVFIKGVFPLHCRTIKYHTLTFSHSRFNLIFYSSLDTDKETGMSIDFHVSDTKQ